VSRQIDESSTLATYLRDIARLPRLTQDEERELGTRIQRGRDEAALNRLVESNLQFVVSCAKRYRRAGVSFLDLIHEGNLGLMQAARRFDPSRNVKFITYAVWWIREAMTHVLAEQTRAFSFPPRLFWRLGATSVDLSLSDTMPGDDAAATIGARLARDEHPAIETVLIQEAELRNLSAALATLDRREREVVNFRFGLDGDEPRTLQEIGDQLHLSRERVRQIESSAKEKLRRASRRGQSLN
jgi:RNA polymerase primary sigma factor